jgi:hypothetical protein
MGQNKKQKRRQAAPGCKLVGARLGGCRRGIFAKIALLARVCFDGQSSMKTSKLTPAIVTRLDREVKFTI